MACTMLPSVKCVFPSIWLNWERKHVSLAQRPHCKIMIWFSPSIVKREPSSGAAFRFNRWVISSQEINMILDAESKCQFIMDRKTLIFVQCLRLSAHRSHKHLVLGITTELMETIELQWLTLVKVQPQKEISILLWTLHQLLVRHTCC